MSTWTGVSNGRYFTFEPNYLAAASVRVLANVTQLREVSRLENNTMAVLEGLNSSGDGEGGIWYWAAGRSDADNPPFVIRPNDFSSSGVWIKSQ